MSGGRLASFLVVVVSLTGYHLAQRSMPTSVGPAPLFAFVYGVSMVAMLGVVALGPGSGGLAAVAAAATHWAPWLLAASVTGIELGVFAMYRTGWTISTGSTTTQAVVAALLVVIGLVRFGEHLTPLRLVGLVLCVAGATLVAR